MSMQQLLVDLSPERVCLDERRVDKTENKILIRSTIILEFIIIYLLLLVIY